MTKVRESDMPAAERWESFFDASGILDALGCTGIAGDAIEFGCGYGTFSMELARRTSGTVFALDIESSMISETRARANRAGLYNVRAEQRDFMSGGSGRPDRSAACALLFNILHVEDPIRLLREAHRGVRDGGIIAVIHWRHDIATPRGPPLDIRPRPEHCRAWAEAAGLEFAGSRDLPHSPWHWGRMVLKRSAEL